MNYLKRIGIVSCAALLIVGAATAKAASEQKYSGYLGDYSKLESVKGEKGEEIRRWVNPKLKRGEYLKLIIDPLVFYPAPQPSKQVSNETLQQIRQYADEALRREVGKSFLLVNQVGPGVARVRIAITGITTEAEGMKPYEFIPVAAIVAGAEAAAGTRKRDSFLVVEVELVDSVTNDKLGMAARKIPGKKQLKGEKDQLTLEMMKPVLDDKAANARLILDRTLK